jgi:hypothetical protein
MVAGVLLLILLALALVGTAAYTSRPFEVAATLIGCASGAVAALATGSFFVAFAAALLSLCALFTVKTVAQTFGVVSTARRAAQPRRRSRPERREEDEERSRLAA